jgi:hypothetical protein
MAVLRCSIASSGKHHAMQFKTSTRSETVEFAHLTVASEKVPNALIQQRNVILVLNAGV